ncbi:Lrp/AsnC ligand binding domain-containing protein [Candidatus Methanocrinis natronophilus]|uniref:Lrp/AsnC ligand binding domain-containing protein n=1 Tax=Candidatus Methanocrinis natronophilus TaxID=3033396 RepID=A0ABT5X706_9EURY|nr:Lrp/AsnC ligand binding domain-containing protein [Candidatus Methanocrinis natronophilus]MDF0590470.1 Lrp/AsnC ligand binding domain-containing protein [Candidatus Methanocrinis natronophilus]
MIDGIIMVKIFPGHERRIHRTLKSLVGIRKIYLLFGDFDFFLNVQVDGLMNLNGLVETIRGTEGVVTTRTILATSFDKFGPPGTEAC